MQITTHAGIDALFGATSADLCHTMEFGMAQFGRGIRDKGTSLDRLTFETQLSKLCQDAILDWTSHQCSFDLRQQPIDVDLSHFCQTHFLAKACTKEIKMEKLLSSG